MDANVDRALEAAAASAVQPEGEEAEAEHLLAGADTFLLLVDDQGRIRANPSGVSVSDLPDLDAVAAAARAGRDLRSGTYAGIDLRLLTVPGPATSEDDDGQGPGRTFIQAGFVLTLHEQQETQLYWTIAIVSLLGLAGAALVTWLVTRRALVPVRTAFATERRFVAAASHELRTPVAIVRASAEILEREGLVADDGRPLVADIVAETDRLGRLVGDMLALASTEAGAVSVDRRPLELVGWLTDLARRAESMVGAQGLSLRTELPGAGPLVVDADDDRLTQLRAHPGRQRHRACTRREHHHARLGSPRQHGHRSRSATRAGACRRLTASVSSNPSRGSPASDGVRRDPGSDSPSPVSWQAATRATSPSRTRPAVGPGSSCGCRWPRHVPLARYPGPLPDSRRRSRVRIAVSSSGSAWSQPQMCSAPWVTSSRSSSAGDHWTSPVWPPRPCSACSMARSTDTMMSPRSMRSAGRQHEHRPGTHPDQGVLAVMWWECGG